MNSRAHCDRIVLLILVSQSCCWMGRDGLIVAWSTDLYDGIPRRSILVWSPKILNPKVGEHCFRLDLDKISFQQVVLWYQTDGHVECRL